VLTFDLEKREIRLFEKVYRAAYPRNLKDVK
jgi:hypothetical protein